LDSGKLGNHVSEYNLAFNISQAYVLKRDFLDDMGALDRVYDINPNLKHY
jgi:hypothetical protein